jgi:hypothetical protein
VIRNGRPSRFPQRRANTADFFWSHVRLAMLPSVPQPRRRVSMIATIICDVREPSTSSTLPRRAIPFCDLSKRPRQCGLIDDFTDDGNDRSGIPRGILVHTESGRLEPSPNFRSEAATMNIDVSGSQSLEMTFTFIELLLRGHLRMASMKALRPRSVAMSANIALCLG